MLSITFTIEIQTNFVILLQDERPTQDTTTPEASGKGGGSTHPSRSAVRHKTPAGQTAPRIRRIRSAPHKVGSEGQTTSSRVGGSGGGGSDHEMEEEARGGGSDDLSSEYHHVALQLLDLMHTLHTRAAQIHESWSEEESSKC